MYGLRLPAVVSGIVLSLAALLLSLAPALASPNGVVISELRARGPAGGNDEFVELFNTSSSDVDISGYKLQGCASTSGSPSDRTTVPAGTVLNPGEHYLFTNSGSSGYSGAVSGDRAYSTGFTDFLSSNASGARLFSRGDGPMRPPSHPARTGLEPAIGRRGPGRARRCPHAAGQCKDQTPSLMTFVRPKS